MEVCIEYPKELNTYKVLEEYMEQASTEYCKFSKIPAKAEVDICWRH